MGREELALALKQKGEEELRAIRHRAEEEAEQYRSESQQELARQCQLCEDKSEQSAAVECQHLTWRVDKRVRGLRLQAIGDLDLRLRQLAATELSRLKPKIRKKYLADLAAEIPAGLWQKVMTHPDDCQTARQLFPDSKVEADATMSGGLVVESENADIRIDNSLSTRLEILWPELSGRIMAELEGSNAQFAATTEE